MRIVAQYPPNYAAIIKAIPAVAKKPGIIFTYGNTIYCPAGNTALPTHLIAHEQIHANEQARMGIEAWWDQYLADRSFRLNQEVLAYRKQYRSCHNRTERKQVLQHITRDLAGEMYGRVVDKQTARELITGEGAL